MMEKLVKVTTYITCDEKLLVFRHVDHPEAGIQVPAGTAEHDEDLELAALREAEEESGLSGFVVNGYLGKTAYRLSLQKAVPLRLNAITTTWSGQARSKKPAGIIGNYHLL